MLVTLLTILRVLFFATPYDLYLLATGRCDVSTIGWSATTVQQPARFIIEMERPDLWISSLVNISIAGTDLELCLTISYTLKAVPFEELFSEMTQAVPISTSLAISFSVSPVYALQIAGTSSLLVLEGENWNLDFDGLVSLCFLLLLYCLIISGIG